MTITDEWRDLRSLRHGLITLPSDDGYDEARRAWNLAVDQRPAAVAVPTSVREVQHVVRAATALGYRVAPQSTGHSAAPLADASLDDTVLLKMHALTGVTVDPTLRLATVMGGTLWADVVASAGEHGLAALHGAPDVAVAGYVLGGGLSFYGRRYGLAANWLLGADVVLADGSLVRADADRNQDLFWALRGGGGNFGVVVRLDIALLPIPDVFAGSMLWPMERAAAVVNCWVELTRSAPDSITSTLRLLSFPEAPGLPPFLAGRRVVVVDAAICEDDRSAAAYLEPLRALTPELDTFARIPASALPEVHMDPAGPTPSVSDHAVLGSLDEAAVAALLRPLSADAESPLFMIELRQLGGALSHSPEGAGALGHLPGCYTMLALGAPRSTAEAVAVRAAATDAVRSLAPWSLPQLFLNFTEKRVDTRAGVDPEHGDMLSVLRAKFDPGRRLRSNHEL
jgi:hypothetical protein